MKFRRDTYSRMKLPIGLEQEWGMEKTFEYIT
jgi:hypothetical protein